MNKKIIITFAILILIVGSFIYFLMSSGYTKIDDSILPNGTMFFYEDCIFSNQDYNLRITGEIIDKDNNILCNPI